MKIRLFYLIPSLILSFVFASCSDKKQKTSDNDGQQFVFEFSNEDSLAISDLANKYVNAFNSQDMESCADLLFRVHNDSVFPLTLDERKDFIASMRHISAFGCERREMALKTDRDNKVYIAIFLSEADSITPQSERPSAKFILNPVKIDGAWHLTVYDPSAEGVGIY